MGGGRRGDLSDDVLLPLGLVVGCVAFTLFVTLLNYFFPLKNQP